MQRTINGTIYSGTPEQLDLREQGETLMGSKVEFETDPGRVRTGTVVAYGMCGGGSMPWALELEIAYRGGRFDRRPSEITVQAR